MKNSHKRQAARIIDRRNLTQEFNTGSLNYKFAVVIHIRQIKGKPCFNKMAK